MGEAKRRKREIDAQKAKPVACRYRPVKAFHIAPCTAASDKGEISFAALEMAEAIRTPNAMRPVGWAFAGAEVRERIAKAISDKVAAEEDACAFDRDGSFLTTYPSDPEEWPDSLTMADYDSHTAFLSEGDPVTFTASIAGGFLDGDGTALDDVPSTFTGLARTWETGVVIVSADAPLCVQVAALSEALAFAVAESDGDRVGQAVDHFTHLIVMAGALAGKDDPGGLVDQRSFGDFLDDAGFGNVPTIVESSAVSEEQNEVLDDARREDPVWRIAGRFPAHMDDWASRDDPGTGLRWTEIDKAVAALARGEGGLTPGVGAQYVEMDNPSTSAAIARKLVESCDCVSADGRSRVGLDRELGLRLAVLENEPGRTVLVAWPVEDASPPRVDPLMAETLAGFLRSMEGPNEDMPEARVEALRSLASLTLLPALPEPFFEPDYSFLMLLAAHARGVSLADFCASLASFAKSVRGGDARGSVVVDDDFVFDDLDRDDDGYGDDLPEPVASFGGTPDDRLTAMIGGIGALDWFDIDLDRDMANLRDAVRAGSNLKDMATAYRFVVDGD